MHVAAWPEFLEVAAGESATFSVTITNTSGVIDAYGVQLFGLDPEWVTVEPSRLSLFPGDVETVTLTVGLPVDYPASQRVLAVHVRSENHEDEFALTQVQLSVEPNASARVSVDPVVVTGGRKASFGLIVANEGNSSLEATAFGIDPEDLAAFEFEPPTTEIPAGQSSVIRATVKGGRPWFGQPKARVLSLGVDADQRVESVATFVQRPRIGRWLLSLMGLLAAAAVFAAVLSRVFDNVVDEAAVDTRILEAALEQDAAGGAAVPVNPGSMSGLVVSSSTGTGVSGVQADLFVADDTTVPIASAATDTDGAFTFGNLGQGAYKVKFSGAGFAGLWYEASSGPAGAVEVEVALGETTTLADFAIGGQPGSVKGEIVGGDPTGALVSLIVPGQLDPDSSPLVAQVEASADGSFLFEEVPSPAVYQLTVEKAGFSAGQRDVVMPPAGQVEGVEVFLLPGDGAVTGMVSSVDGPLGGATVTATDGVTTIETVTLTEGGIGSFALRNLTTPGQYTITISRPGYTSESRSVSLDTGQVFSGFNARLASGVGSIRGVTSVNDIGPTGGIEVRITGGDVDLTTTSVSQGGEIGSYVIDQLPIPGTYTLTYSAEGLVSQVRLEDLDPLAGRGDIVGIDATLIPNQAVVRGTIRTAAGLPAEQAMVTLSDGTTDVEFLTANSPAGEFEFFGVAPGAYTLSASLTGTEPIVVLVNVLPAETEQLDLRLGVQASLAGTVLRLDPETDNYVPFADATVRLFAVGDFPGVTSSAQLTVSTAANGTYTFPNLAAPDDWVIAVYPSPTAGDALDSRLVTTQPGVAVTVPAFRVTEVL